MLMHTTDVKLQSTTWISCQHLPTDSFSPDNVVQSHGTASAPADYSTGSNKQHAEGDVHPVSGIRHQTDPTRGPEDPAWIWTVSVLLHHLNSISCNKLAAVPYLTVVQFERLLGKVYHLLWVNRFANMCPEVGLIRHVAFTCSYAGGLDKLLCLNTCLRRYQKETVAAVKQIWSTWDTFWNTCHGFYFPRVQFQLWDSDDLPVPRQEMLEKVKGVDALLCVLTEKIDAELLDAAGQRTVPEPVEWPSCNLQWFIYGCVSVCDAYLQVQTWRSLVLCQWVLTISLWRSWRKGDRLTHIH